MRVAQSYGQAPRRAAQGLSGQANRLFNVVDGSETGFPHPLQIRLHLDESPTREQLGERGRRGLPGSPHPAAALREELLHDRAEVFLHRALRVVHHRLPDSLDRLAHVRARIVLHAVQLGQELGEVRRERVPRALGDAREPVRRAFTAVEHGLVVGQVHELVYEVGLADVGDDRAQLFVRAEAPAAGGARGGVAVLLLSQFLVVNLDRALLEHLRVVVELDPALALALSGQHPHEGPEELLPLIFGAQLVHDADAAAGHLLRQLVLITEQTPERLLDLG